MNILNGNEAFTALMAGKKIMCRAVDQLVDFNDLDQFPATIFAMPGYEFSIKIDLIEVAGITFTKPLTLDEYQDGQDVFVICTYGPSVYVVNFKTSALIESINSGFVQRDAENAKLQLQAICKAFGRELDADCLVVRLGEDPNKPEKKRQSRKKADTSVAIADVEPLGVEGDDTPWDDKAKEDELVESTQAITIIAQENVTTSEDSLIDEIDSQATKAVQDKIYKDAISGNAPSSYPIDMLYSKKKQMLINRIYDMDSVEALERLAPAIPAAKLKPEDHQELLSIYAERKTAMMHVDGVAS